MLLSTETFGNVLVAHTPDELTEDTVNAFEEAMTNLIDANHTQIVLQMDRSDTFDGLGLTSLLDIQDHIREQGGNLKVCGLGESGKKVFELTRLDKRFDLFDSIIDAVSSFQ